MTGGFTRPSDVAPPVRVAGGDSEVPRDKSGRPRIVGPCGRCEGTGKVPSPSTGRPIQCSTCKGAGTVERSYTRTTTYIDVIEDKSNLMAWGERMVLLGIADDPRLLHGALDLLMEQQEAERELARLPKDASDEEKKAAKDAVKAPKDALNKKAQIAKEKAGASNKADKGTFLHGLSEMVDLGQPLPKDIEFGDVIDMHAYAEATKGFKIRHMEKLVVHDGIKVAGTPDRVSEWVGDQPLVAPDGYVFEPGGGELIITDLKTGTVEYGALKMAMQLSIYSRSELYDHITHERAPLENINQKWGIIMNVPAGTGEATLYWADLELGWEAVEIAGAIRRLRGVGRSKALTRVA